MLGLSLCFTGCESDSFSTRVSFANDTRTRTVVAVWDGLQYATLSPGETSVYHETEPGRHAMQWYSTSGRALTSIRWYSIEEGTDIIVVLDD